METYETLAQHNLHGIAEIGVAIEALWNSGAEPELLITLCRVADEEESGWPPSTVYIHDKPAENLLNSLDDLENSSQMSDLPWQAAIVRDILLAQ